MSKKKSKGKVGGGKAAHVQNLVKKGNWRQIKKLAAEGHQEAVNELKKREGAAEKNKGEAAKAKGK